MSRKYNRKLWGEINTGNYQDKSRKRGNRRVPLPFRGKQAENCSHNVGKSLEEGLAHKAKIP